MTWKATTVDGLIVVTDGGRRLEALTTEPHPTVIGQLIAETMNTLDRVGGDPAGVTVVSTERLNELRTR